MQNRKYLFVPYSDTESHIIIILRSVYSPFLQQHRIWSQQKKCCGWYTWKFCSTVLTVAHNCVVSEMHQHVTARATGLFQTYFTILW